MKKKHLLKTIWDINRLMNSIPQTSQMWSDLYDTQTKLYESLKGAK